MRAPLRRVVRAYRSGGAGGLAAATVDRAREALSERAAHVYWRARGTRTLRVGDASATFHTEYPTEIDVLRYLDAHERDVMADLLSALADDDVVFDVGANIGVYSFLAADVVADGNVVAFEPYPPNVERLRANRSLNGLEGAVPVHGIGLSDGPGVVSFDREALDQPGWPLASVTDGTGETVEVEVAAGDDLVAQGEVPRPTVVKIDVEGAEPLVLEGLRETLADDRCRLVYCEVHGESDLRRSAADFGAGPAAIESFLVDCGFDVEWLQDRAHERYLKGRK